MITQAGGDATNIWQKQLVRFLKFLIIKWDVSDEWWSSLYAAPCGIWAK